MIAPLLPGSQQLISLGTGLSWALATPEEHRQQLAVELAEFLVQADYLADWTREAGYLPATVFAGRVVKPENSHNAQSD